MFYFIADSDACAVDNQSMLVAATIELGCPSSNEGLGYFEEILLMVRGATISLSPTDHSHLYICVYSVLCCEYCWFVAVRSFVSLANRCSACTQMTSSS